VCRGRGNDIQVDQLNNKGSAKMSRWEGLDEFVAVAEIGSFSRAAERLRVSSSHVSRQVALLEERLQARLLYRTTRRVSLTEAGQTFFARCQRLIEERDEAF
jgi:DNA-binding transcriptional LysR family regulator